MSQPCRACNGTGEIAIIGNYKQACRCLRPDFSKIELDFKPLKAMVKIEGDDLRCKMCLKPTGFTYSGYCRVCVRITVHWTFWKDQHDFRGLTCEECGEKAFIEKGLHMGPSGWTVFDGVDRCGGCSPIKVTREVVECSVSGTSFRHKVPGRWIASLWRCSNCSREYEIFDTSIHPPHFWARRPDGLRCPDCEDKK